MGDVTGINEQPERRPITMGADSRPVSRSLEEIVVAARALAGDLAGAVPGRAEADRELLGDAAARLRRSVIGPLERASAVPQAGAAAGTERAPTDPGDGEPARSPRERLWELARETTVLRTDPGASNELLEATAALQDLAYRFALAADPESARSRLSELRAIQAELPRAVRAARNGPYLVTNAERLVSWLGVPLPSLPQMALCRCGASALKPFCDGAHAEVGFTDEKDPERVLDRRDTYVGQQVTIFDNRGTCAHSGFCSDRLRTVFRPDQEPFVAPSGGRMDEIIAAVRACPSGALSFALDGHEAREQVDQEREQAIEVSKDGPYRVTGGLPLEDAAGNPERRNEGASLEHYSLCRCGRSRNKPFCSGRHWQVGFRDPVPDPDYEPTLFEWAGGLPALTRMTRIFYGKYVPQDPLLGPLFANMSPDHPERVAAWLGEVFGGPKAYSEGYGGYERMVSQHLGKALREEQRARWVELLSKSADDAKLPADAEWRAAFVAYLEWGSRIGLENSQPGAHPPPHMPVPRWWWVCDATPSRRVSALAAEEPEQQVDLPGPDEPLSFEQHIKPLFRERDRQSMRFAFDLWSHDDVGEHADAILDRLRAGTMPCDGAWPEERVEAFKRWLDSGKAA
jgi:CDGSH-type Zn-finger protein/truncated hemoglobin YjbI/ferredoxin